ncbi:hypothetical protein GCM10009665_50790 [Kitasatospora nipponensis]|uniref:RNA polymerase sigma factor n=1 Tax=Kitasatospora nipponensis TaxID=258049 RepID=A0ABN1WPT2_9ACTN
MSDAHRTVNAVWRLESARIVAALVRLVHDVGLAEELAQDALVAALEQWPVSGVPDRPGAWLTTIARRRAVDHIRRARGLEHRQDQLAREARELQFVDVGAELGDEPDAGAEAGQGGEQDDVLRLMFISCHPVLPTDARVALTLRLLGGLTAEEIARAFLAAPTTITRRIAAAKRTLAEERVPFELPARSALAERLSSVLEVIYLVFNEGYSATSGDDLMRPGLCHEALRLGRLLAGLAPDEAEVHGLVALMEIQASRAAARTGPSGEPVQLHEQNRGRWDQLLIRRGFTAMLRARQAGGPPGPYVLQAAIAVCHAQARTAESTDWGQIATLYDALVRLLPTAIVRLNRAVAVGRARGPQAGLALVDALVDDPALRDYHLLPSVRGDLLERLGRCGEARLEFERAASLTGNAAERAFLLRRADSTATPQPTPTPTPGPESESESESAEAVATLGTAARAFLAREELDPGTIRSYGQTLRRLRLALGDGLPLTALTADRVARVFATAWGGAAAPTWNRHRSAVRSFGAWASLDDLGAGLDRRVETRPRLPTLTSAEVDALCGRPGLALRERVLWRLLHESGATVAAVLALNVEELDFDDRRAGAGTSARQGSRGGQGSRVGWRAGTARLLPALVGDRTRGPLFLTDRRPGPARTPEAVDRCPDTGRARLSYERAEYLFKQATRSLDPTGQGYTLRRLRSRP